MKKLISILLMVCACLCVGMLLTACDEEGTTTHTHAYGEWTETQAPTCVAKGKREKTCTCGDKVTEEIAMVAHTEETLPAKAATCIATGLTEGKKCTVCGTVTVKQEEVPLEKHAYAAAWSKDEENHWHECTTAGCTAVADSAAHTWNAGEVTVKPGEQTAGEKLLTCTACAATKKVELPPIGNSKVANAAAWDAAVTYSGNYMHTIDMYWEEDGELLYAGRQLQIRYGDIIKIDNDDYFTKEGGKYYSYSLHVRTDDGGETFYEQWERKETSSFYFDMLAANFSSLQGLFSSFVYNEEDGWYYGDDVTVQGSKMDVKVKFENGRVVGCRTEGISWGELQVTEYSVEYKDVQLTPPTLEKKPHTHVHGYWKDLGDGVHHVSVCGYCDSVMEQKEAHVWDETNTVCTGCRLSKKEQTEE